MPFLRGAITYSLAPSQQRVMQGAVSHIVKDMKFFAKGSWGYSVFPLVGGWGVYKWSQHREHEIAIEHAP
jgi:UcrQ family